MLLPFTAALISAPVTAFSAPSRVTAGEPVITAHRGRYPSESPLIIERPGQGFGFPEIPLHPEFGQWEERVSKLAADIDSLFPRLAGLGEMGQRRPSTPLTALDGTGVPCNACYNVP